MHSRFRQIRLPTLVLFLFLIARPAGAQKPVVAVDAHFSRKANWVFDAIQQYYASTTNQDPRDYIRASLAVVLTSQIQGFSFVSAPSPQAVKTVHAIVGLNETRDVKITLCQGEPGKANDDLVCTSESIVFENVFKESDGSKKGSQGDGRKGIAYALKNTLLQSTVGDFFKAFENQKKFLDQLRIPLSLRPPAQVGAQGEVKTQVELYPFGFVSSRSIFKVILGNTSYQFRACGARFIDGKLSVDRSPPCSPATSVSSPQDPVQEIFYLGRAGEEEAK